MLRGSSAKEGLCGIATLASYPVKSSSFNPKGPTSSLKDELWAFESHLGYLAIALVIDSAVSILY